VGICKVSICSTIASVYNHNFCKKLSSRQNSAKCANAIAASPTKPTTASGVTFGSQTLQANRRYLIETRSISPEHTMKKTGVVPSSARGFCDVLLKSVNTAVIISMEGRTQMH
jgi:hypothetical protein